MTLGNLFVVNAVISLVFGVAAVLAPALLMSSFGATLSPAGILVARLLGATFLGIGVLTWFARNAADSEARQAIVLGLFVENAIGFVVALLGQFALPGNPFSWLIVALYLLFALGYGYFQFLKPTGS